MGMMAKSQIFAITLTTLTVHAYSDYFVVQIHFQYTYYYTGFWLMVRECLSIKSLLASRHYTHWPIYSVNKL